VLHQDVCPRVYNVLLLKVGSDVHSTEVSITCLSVVIVAPRHQLYCPQPIGVADRDLSLTGPQTNTFCTCKAQPRTVMTPDGTLRSISPGMKRTARTVVRRYVLCPVLFGFLVDFSTSSIIFLVSSIACSYISLPMTFLSQCLFALHDAKSIKSFSNSSMLSAWGLRVCIVGDLLCDTRIAQLFAVENTRSQSFPGFCALHLVVSGHENESVEYRVCWRVQ